MAEMRWDPGTHHEIVAWVINQDGDAYYRGPDEGGPVIALHTGQGRIFARPGDTIVHHRDGSWGVLLVGVG